MSKSKRTLVNIGIFGTLLLLPFVPWYFIFVASIIASWHYTYYEFLLVGFIIDLSYDSNVFFTVFNHPFPLPWTLFAAAILAVLHLVKKRVRF